MCLYYIFFFFFFFQAEDGIRDWSVTGVQTCALPICPAGAEARDQAPARELVERGEAACRHRRVAKEVAENEMPDAHAARGLGDHGRLHHRVVGGMVVALPLRPLVHQVVGEVDRVEAEALGGLRHVAQLLPVREADLQAELHDANRASSRRAMVCLCTSSGPSARRSMRPSRHMRASGVSSETPRAPCTWMARSSTFMKTFAATTLIIEISCRASFLPTVSIFHAA